MSVLIDGKKLLSMRSSSLHAVSPSSLSFPSGCMVSVIRAVLTICLGPNPASASPPTPFVILKTRVWNAAYRALASLQASDTSAVMQVLSERCGDVMGVFLGLASDSTSADTSEDCFNDLPLVILDAAIEKAFRGLGDRHGSLERLASDSKLPDASEQESKDGGGFVPCTFTTAGNRILHQVLRRDRGL